MIFTDRQFTCLVDKYIDTVFRVALNYLKNPADAEDVTQNVFEKLLRQRKAFESEGLENHVPSVPKRKPPRRVVFFLAES